MAAKKSKRTTVKPGSQGMKWIRPEKREAIYQRAEKVMGKRCCTYCCTEVKSSKRGGSRPNAPTLDHVVSHYLGGPNTPDNLVLCCFKCNRLKHDLPLKKFVELLEAQGLNPKKVYKRIKAQTDKPIDLAAGKAAILAQGRKLNGYKNGGR